MSFKEGGMSPFLRGKCGREKAKGAVDTTRGGVREGVVDRDDRWVASMAH
jgi:hypothetical protein